MLNDRRRRVLSALVEEYIASATPVGSKTLVERYELGCSPATVRNELSILEETGFVVQPHISAGRMPTDTGYRDFVDRILERAGSIGVEPASLPHANEVDDLMRETSALLTRLTDSLAVVLAPSISLSRVKRVDLLSMAPRKALFVLITESGRVINRHMELAEDATPEQLSQIERSLNASLQDKKAFEICPMRDALAATADSEQNQSAPGSALFAHILDEIIDALDEADRDRLYHVGFSALLAQPEFQDSQHARPLLESVEDGLALLETLSEALASPGLTVRIGHENIRTEFGGVSIVATKYGAGPSDGVVGIIGPTRMDYEKVMTAVKAVADGLSEALT
jgi:heat-inducible transcriptional repressor